MQGGSMTEPRKRFTMGRANRSVAEEAMYNGLRIGEHYRRLKHRPSMVGQAAEPLDDGGPFRKSERFRSQRNRIEPTESSFGCRCERR